MLAKSDLGRPHVAVVGAGIGGLAAALLLARAGAAVTVLEKADAPGGKLRTVTVGGVPIDSGPTVLTMRPVFEALFAAAGERLSDHLTLEPLDLLARHHWPDGPRLDLFRDVEQSAEAIATFAGAGEADAYRRYSRLTREVYGTLAPTFIEAETPSVQGLVAGAGIGGLPSLARIRAFSTLWSVLRGQFRDERLRQLFGRYATYCGSSPFEAPGPLMLIAHVEQQGVWRIREGMHALALAAMHLTARAGAVFRFGEAVAGIGVRDGRSAVVETAGGEAIACDAVVFNGDPAALAAGLLGNGVRRAPPAVKRGERSLSAVTLGIVAETSGFPLAHHNVFFSGDYGREFDALRKRRRIPDDPTVYLCAQDRSGDRAPGGPERLFTITNAPPDGDLGRPNPDEARECMDRTLARLGKAGLDLTDTLTQMTTPQDFDALFPATGGALYGRSSHGWMASFTRPTARTAIPGLYLAGGAVHPGAGLPMAALSGRNAAMAILSDFASTSRSPTGAIAGGMWTR